MLAGPVMTRPSVPPPPPGTRTVYTRRWTAASLDQATSRTRTTAGQSHWSSSFITVLSLVESFVVMLRRLSYAIKNQLKAPKAPTKGFSYPLQCLYGLMVASMQKKDL